MVYFTTAIDKYFASWILPDTWYTSHTTDMARFYRFVMAIHYFSKPVEMKPPRTPDDPCFSHLSPGLRQHFAKKSSQLRNPRTYDAKAFRENIIIAIKRNHMNFDEKYAQKLADKFTEQAIFLLDALYFIKEIGFPHAQVQKWNPPLK